MQVVLSCHLIVKKHQARNIESVIFFVFNTGVYDSKITWFPSLEYAIRLSSGKVKSEVDDMKPLSDPRFIT